MPAKSSHSLYRAVRLVAMLAALCATQAYAETVLRIGHTATPDSAMGIFTTEWAKRANELSNGQLNMQVFHNAQLGDERVLVESMRLGTVDGGVITHDVLLPHVKEFTVIGLPMAFNSYEDAHRFLNGRAGDILKSKLEPVGLKGFSFADIGFRSMGNNQRSIRTPNDLKKLKIRVIEAPLPLEVVGALGATPVPVAWQETIPALKQGIVDGLATGTSYFYLGRVYEYVKYFTFTNHSYSAMVTLMSKDRYDSLPAHVQQAIDKAAREAAVVAIKANAQIEKKMVPILEANGNILNRIEDPKPFRDLVQPIWAKYEGTIGSDLMRELRELSKE